jgi:antitoxin component YwqK of YwqJK toxin-antitoxin module
MKTLRRICAPIVLALFMNCSFSRHDLITTYMTDVDTKRSGKYTVIADEPIDGLLTEHYPTGEIKKVSRYQHGLQHGLTRTWYADGRKESERFFLDGEKEGLHVGWWPNGNKQFEYQFSNGLYHGTFKEWYETGKPLHIFEYHHGKEVSAIGWRENGRTYINFAMRNGRKYGLTNARLCFSLKDEAGVYRNDSSRVIRSQ